MKKRSASDLWRNHQCKSISDAIEKVNTEFPCSDELVIEPLFPGSYLCNQLLIHNFTSDEVTEFSAAEVPLEIIYESLSGSASSLLESAILIDGASLDDCNKSLFDVVSSLIKKLNNVNMLIVLDPLYLMKVARMFRSLPVSVKCIKPDWNNPGQVLSFYRTARHCVFIDTHRAADAALCDCAFTFIASSRFTASLQTDDLWRCLELSTNGSIVGEIPASGKKSGMIIIENRLSELRRLRTGESRACPDDSADWLDEYEAGPLDNQPVVDNCVSRWHKPVQRAVDLRISIRRKGLKLQEDPRQFCSDSSNPVLRQLAKILPIRDTA